MFSAFSAASINSKAAFQPDELFSRYDCTSAPRKMAQVAIMAVATTPKTI